MTSELRDLLNEVETFLRQVSRMQPDDLLERGADIHDVAAILADQLNVILEDDESA